MTCERPSHEPLLRMTGRTESANAPDPPLCASYLKALADPTRLRIVRALQAGALSVSDIAILLETEIANVSHHLRVLFHANLVTTEREGKYIYYNLNSDFRRQGEVEKSLDFGCCKIDLRD